VLQRNGEEGLIKGRFNTVEEGSLSLGRHSVDAAESKTEKAVVVGVLLELRTDCLGSLNSLVRCSNATNSNGIRVNISAGTASITIRDRPGVATKLCSTSARIIHGVARLLGGRELS
jgi:hypothetical protein